MKIDLEFDPFFIVFDNLCFEFICYLFMMSHDFKPLFASNEIALAWSKRFVNKTRLFIESQIISTDNIRILELQWKSFFTIKFETYVISAFIKEDNPVNFR